MEEFTMNHQVEHNVAVLNWAAAEGHQTETISQERLGQAKAAYTTRAIPTGVIATLLSGDLVPEPGDLMLARVTRIRQHTRIELGSGRRAQLFPDDEVVVCYGNRYAPDQFEALVPDDLGPCHLVAAGGVAARVLSRHGAMKAPTEIMPIGLLGDQHGCRINLADWALPKVSRERLHPGPFTVAVVGTAMNAGKTTTAAALIRGLARSGLKVGAAKVTGTGAGLDAWLMTDSGATRVVDFTDAGYASTYRVPLRELEDIVLTLTGHLQEMGVDAIVLEVADGLLQDETAALVASPIFAATVDGVIFAAGDAMGAAGGIAWLQRHGLRTIGVSGLLSASPLALREAARVTEVPAFTRDQLSSSGVMARLSGRAWSNYDRKMVI